MDPGRNKFLLPVAVSLLWWLPALFIIGVGGDFPLNDDFAYARALWEFLESGRVGRLRWTWTPIYSNVFWGALFTKLGGESFVSLRVSGLVAGWLGVMGSYALARALGVSQQRAWCAAAVVALSPVYVNLSNTFMTEPLFVAASTWSLVCMVRAFEPVPSAQKLAWVAGGATLALVALGSRQVAIALPVGVALTLALRYRHHWRRVGAVALFLVVVVLGMETFGPSRRGPGVVGPMQFINEMVMQPQMLYNLVRNISTSAAYLGWFCAPLVLMNRVRRGQILFAAAGMVLGAALLFRLHLKALPGINIIYQTGLGPPTIDGAEKIASFPDAIWAAGTCVGLFCFSLYVAQLLEWVWERRSELDRLVAPSLIFGTCSVYFFAHAVRLPFFDRYLMFMVPPLLALAASLSTHVPSGWLRRGPMLACLVVLSVFSIGGTRDYMAHHVARNQVLDQMAEQGLTPVDIAGGFEFNALHRPRESKWTRDRVYFAPDSAITRVEQADGPQCAGELASYRRWLPPRIECVRSVPIEPVPIELDRNELDRNELDPNENGNS